MNRQKIKNITLIGVFAALLCVVAPFSLPIGIVPISLATFMVYLLSAIFEPWIATGIIAVYIALGAMGLPVFAGVKGGLGVLFGPTGGFIWAYLLAALVESLLIYLFKDKKWMVPLSMLLGTLVIYGGGLAYFLIYMKGSYSFLKAIEVCVVPFLLGDGIKIAVATALSYVLRPIYLKTSTNKNKE
ncbi:MAG: biotin transporter BioY [Bacilli bacterium]|nr:biotin transporter BioY [Bacilli bacterium]